MFNSGYEITGSTQYFYHNSSGTAAATSDVYIKVTGVDHEYHDIYLVGNIPTFKNGEQEMEMGPGLLEPMLDTDFAPVGIDTIPAWEAGLDADIFTNIVLNAWKGVIDDRIQNIYARLNTLPAYDTDQKLRDLTAAENKDSECDNFQITLESGSPVRDPDDVDAGKYHAATLPNADNTSTPITTGSTWHSKTVTAVWQDAENIWWWTVEDDPNQYTISGGDIAYGDNTISVVGLSGLYAPFYAYLMPSFDVTITHTDVVAADVPTVVDGGTARMITDGDVLPSGGTVTGFTSSGSGAATRYAWETVGDNTAEIRTKTGSQLSEEGTADPEPGGNGIGGVRIIQSAAESDPLILYKIYHEDCIAGIEKPEAAADAATAGWLRLSPVFPYEEELMNVEIPSGTEGVDPTVIGATAGIVQPVHNIQIHGSTEYRTQSPVDVPTVEAVYNFIHNYDDFADGEFEQASALATGSTMYTDGSSVAIYTKEVSGYTGSLAVPGTAIVATDIKTILVEGRTVTASGCVPTAQAVVDYIGELTFDGVGSTVGIIDYTTNVPETLWPIPGSTVDPAAGYVQNVRNIYVAGTHSVSGYAVPTVDAVYNFIHNIAVEGMTFSSALVTGGTLAEITTTAEDVTTVTGYTATGKPGTCYMATVIPVGSTVSIGLDNCAPTVQAVIDYVAAMDVDSVAGLIAVSAGTESLASVQGTTAAAGIVQPVKNIDIGTQDPNAVSPTAVPTVEAVYNFIHGNTITGYDVADAKADIVGSTTTATGSTAAALIATAKPGTFFVTNDFTVMGGTVTTYNDPQAVPTVLAVYNYIKEKVVSMTGATVGILATTSGSPYEYIKDITGFTHATGAIQPVVNILVNGNTAQRPESHNDVPTVEAVWNFIHGYTISGTEQSTALATIGTITGTTTGADPTITGTTFTGGVPGTFDVTGTIVATADKHSVTNVVPTAEAVVRYIASLPEVAINDAVPGTITVKNSQETWWIETVTGGTIDHTAVRGIADETYVIIVAGTHGLSSVTVPTTEAVYNFIHDIAVTGKTPSSAYAVVAGTTTTTAGGSTATIVTTAIPGTFLVTDDIRVLGTTVTAWSGKEAVPTALAVAEYVRQYIVVGATAGTLDVTGSTTEYWSSVSPAKTPVPGYVYTTTTIVVGDTPSISLYAVPTAKAVNDFVAGYTASVGGFSVTAADKEDWETTGTPATKREAEPGIVSIVDTLVAAATVSNRTLSISTVPTVAAVKDYVDEHIPGAPVSGQLDFNGNFVNGTTVTAGIVKVSTNVKGGAAGSDARTAVPTADAVYTFVSGYQAVIGLLYAPEGDTEEWQSGHTGTSGMITVVGNMDVAPDSNNRTISKYSVPTADAVYDFVHGLVTGATAGTMEEETPEDAPTGEACTGAVSGIVLVARNVWLLDDYSDRTVSNHAVPTVEAVYNFIRGYTDNYAGGASYPVADILAIPGRLGVSADGTRDSWLTGTDYAPTQGVVQTASNIVAGSIAGASTAAVPTVRAIYNFIHSKSTFTPGRALATGSTITAPVQGTTVATYAAGGTPGTCYVCEDMEGLYGSTVTLSPTYGTHSLASVVPTVEAVKNYVAAHGGTSGGAYTGYFAADENGIADGIAIFGSTVINVTGSTTALTGTQSAWAVIWKNDNGSWGGTVGTAYSTGIKKVSYLVARRVNNEIKQVQYGGISIEGRWD